MLFALFNVLMRVAFIIQRRNYFKYMGPLIRAAANRGWQCEVWLYGQDGGKAYLVPSQENLPPPIVNLVSPRTFNNMPELQGLVNSAPDVIVSLHALAIHELSLAANTRFVTLQHGLDTFLESNPDQLASSDAVYYYSEFWIDWAASYYEAEGIGAATDNRKRLAKNGLAVGTPQMDAAIGLNKDEICRKLGIPSGKPIVLFLPVNLSYWPGEWPRFFAANSRWSQIRQFLRAIRKNGWDFALNYWHWALAGWNDATLVQAIRHFADHNDALLIIKTRAKDPIRSAAENLADLALTDEQYYPSTILQLVAVADLCIHFYSSAVFEAAFLGTYAICVHRPNLDTHAHRLWRTNNIGDAYNFPGVNTWTTIPDMITEFPLWDITDLNITPALQATFVERFLETPKPVSPTILDHIETLVTHQPGSQVAEG